MRCEVSHERLNYAARMREQGFRVTPQRQLILDAVCEGGGHTTFEEIYERVRAKTPVINRATVYRALDFFRRLRLVFSAEIEGHTVYEIAGQPHHHLLCRRCGGVEDLAGYHFDALAEHLFEAYGFRAELDHLVITGLCAQCLSANMED